MRFFRSLRILVNAILNTVKNCVWTSLLLCMILYIFGVLFAQASIDHLLDKAPNLLTVKQDKSEEELLNLLNEYFSTLPRSIFTCFKSILGGIDWEIAVLALVDLGWFYVMIFVLLIVFVYL